MGGGTLEKLIAESAVAPARAVEIAGALLAALGEAHRLGVLHRDIKPANVLFDDAGTTRLGDFGVAHLGDLSATATAGVIGTLAYMSPEQREGRPATVQSDLYGVGMILFEMLTGERPGGGEEVRARPSGVHRDLNPRHDEAVLRLISRDPGARPADAFAARRALVALEWPSVVEPAAPRPSRERQASDRPPATRLGLEAGGRTIDRWIGRTVERVPLDEKILARARAFARAGHPALQTVLRVARDNHEIWLDTPRGRPLSVPLTAPQASALRAALDALHAEGAVHGSVDAEHVHVDAAGAVTLLFTREVDPTATVDRDRLALSRLESRRELSPRP
jgi:serine/threonine-protein kinase